MWSAVWGLQAVVGSSRAPAACSALRRAVRTWAALAEAGVEEAAMRPATGARVRRPCGGWQSAAAPVGLRGGASGVWARGPWVR